RHHEPSRPRREIIAATIAAVPVTTAAPSIATPVITAPTTTTSTYTSTTSLFDPSGRVRQECKPGTAGVRKGGEGGQTRSKLLVTASPASTRYGRWICRAGGGSHHRSGRPQAVQRAARPQEAGRRGQESCQAGFLSGRGGEGTTRRSLFHPELPGAGHQRLGTGRPCEGSCSA